MTYEINVENIKCTGCAHSITSSLMKISGVQQVQVHIAEGIVEVQGENDLLREHLVSRLHSMGYPEPGKGNGLIKATSYVSCMIGKVTS